MIVTVEIEEGRPAVEQLRRAIFKALMRRGYYPHYVSVRGIHLTARLYRPDRIMRADVGSILKGEREGALPDVVSVELE